MREGGEDQAIISLIHRTEGHDGFEQEKFAEESGQGRNAGQRDHRDGHGGGQQGRALMQTG